MEERSPALQIILEHYFPDGLPSEEEIKKMNDQNKKELFEKQALVISQFRQYTVSELQQIEFQIMETMNKANKLPETTQKQKSSKTSKQNSRSFSSTRKSEAKTSSKKSLQMLDVKPQTKGSPTEEQYQQLLHTINELADSVNTTKHKNFRK